MSKLDLATKTALIEAFSEYLETLPEQEEEINFHCLIRDLPSQVWKDAVDHVDKASLLQKQTLEMMTMLQNQQRQLQQQEQLLNTLQTSQNRFQQRQFLLLLVEFYDRMQASTVALQNYQPVNALFRHSQKKDIRFIRKIMQGQNLLLERLEQILSDNAVETLQTIGVKFDPHKMTVMALANNARLQDGVVTQEHKKGFLLRGEVLRLAGVTVNRLPKNAEL